MASGRIKFFNKERGFGFITTDGSEDNIFFHISQWKGKESPSDKQSVTFDTKDSKKGLQAQEVTPI